MLTMESISTSSKQYARAIRQRFLGSSNKALYSNRLSDNDIRLLTILPSHNVDAPIVCHLRQHEVSTAPAYEGLSYVWGDPKDVVPVSCNGINVKITKSLRTALWRIRDTEEPRIIWADALCMNQRDVEEKNIHVPLMGRVFSRATNTVIHLGEAKQSEALEAKEGLEVIANSMEDFRIRSNLPVDDNQAFYESIVVTLPELSRPTFSPDAIKNLFGAKWFSRTWCVQEIMLARDSALDSYAIYGHVRVPYRLIAKVSLFLIVASKLNIPFAQELGLSDSVAAIELEERSNQAGRNLLQILDAFCEHQSSDPRDKVYGLLGILRQRSAYNPEAISVDYSKSVAQVYTDTALEILRTNNNLEVLDHVANAEDSEPDTEFPTWVPRWDLPRGWVLFLDDDMDSFRSTCSAVLRTDNQVPNSWSVQGNRLLVSGCRYGQVSSVLSLKGTEQEATISELWRDTQASRMSCFDSQEELFAMARTFAVGQIRHGLHFDTANDEQKEMFMADFLAFIHHFVPRCSPKCPGASEDSCYTIDANGTRRAGSAERYASIFQYSCSRRKLFQTTQEAFGVGPDYLHAGDLIVGLIGGSSPFALRPQGDNYLMIGSVYIDMLMDGKVFRRLLDDGMKERFTLI
ncbi:heterokaryon incompatibility protein-domain-containing protein [Boeremia exigua]|uniref:heterokaryon incompatibility protein-domain-containing protein n=1 Tax=Boeremia exigua TaxID=749465 RepID=UPI001E8CB80B|nr:heterokaryon incompatibility protein-domain-containing protein [Boeremia exigua]KAH6642310.1 heterokaryon incompatibility protein-domain-containing protein [Boeremia exigua]